MALRYRHSLNGQLISLGICTANISFAGFIIGVFVVLWGLFGASESVAQNTAAYPLAGPCALPSNNQFLSSTRGKGTSSVPISSLGKNYSRAPTLLRFGRLMGHDAGTSCVDVILPVQVLTKTYAAPNFYKTQPSNSGAAIADIQSVSSTNDLVIGAHFISVRQTPIKEARLFGRYFFAPFSCNGSSGTDIGTALARADAVAASNRQILVLPAGTCRIKTGFSVVSNSYWQGAETVLYIDPSASSLSGCGLSATILFCNVNNISLSAVVFEGAGSNTTNQNTRVAFDTTSNVVLDNGTSFNNFGNSSYYIQGLTSFVATNWLVDHVTANGNSGDGIAFSNSPTNVTVRYSTMSGNGDDGLVCTVGGNAGPIWFIGNNISNSTNFNIESDRCANIWIRKNYVSGAGSDNLGIRVTRTADTSDLNYNIHVDDNTVIGGGISGEALAVKQGSYIAARSMFTFDRNIVIKAPGNGIQFYDAENGEAIGNVIVYPSGDVLDLIAQTFGVTTQGVTITETVGIGGNYGIRQITASGTMGASAIGFGDTLSGQSIAAYVITNATVRRDQPRRQMR